VSTAEHHHHKAVDRPSQEEQAAAAEEPKGQARLSLMIFSILTFVLLGGWAFAWTVRRYTSLLYPSPMGKSITLPILLPPPRPIVWTR
jgi:hypothetical protein